MIEVIKFSAKWCAPCASFKPIFDEVEKKYKDIKFTSVDVEEQPDFAAKYRVMSIPTTILLIDWELTDSKTGTMTTDELITFIRK